MNHLRCVLILATAFNVLGCTGNDGPPRYRLEGAITYDGQPVSFGWIVFDPEKGPGATANIKDGRYETPEGFGTIGGMHEIEVVAFNAAPETTSDPAGSTEPLFTYKFQHDLPAKAETWDIIISSDDIEQRVSSR